MIRSMNGKPFPNDSPEMRAMIAYFTYISEGIPVGAESSLERTKQYERNSDPESR